MPTSPRGTTTTRSCTDWTCPTRGSTRPRKPRSHRRAAEIAEKKEIFATDAHRWKAEDLRPLLVGGGSLRSQNVLLPIERNECVVSDFLYCGCIFYKGDRGLENRETLARRGSQRSHEPLFSV